MALRALKAHTFSPKPPMNNGRARKLPHPLVLGQAARQNPPDPIFSRPPMYRCPRGTVAEAEQNNLKIRGPFWATVAP
jgi:hypothetical protein